MNGYNFTERVRHILARSRDESNRLHHEYIGTEHILLALIRDDGGVADAVFTNLNIDVDRIAHAVEEIVKPGRSNVTEHEMLPYTSRAKKVLELSMAEARDLNHSYVGSEHLLMGLLREEKGIAAQVLVDAGLTTEKARAEVVRLLGTGEAKGPRTFSAELSTLWNADLDALTAASQYHRLLLENEFVRILDTEIPPGETTPLHTHRWPAAHYVLSWSDFVRRDSDGVVLLDTRQTDFNRNSPQALWGAPLAAHTLENVGSVPLHIISVEIKSHRRY